MIELKEGYFERKARDILNSGLVNKTWLTDGINRSTYQQSKAAVKNISIKLGTNYKKCAILAQNSIDWVHIALSVILNNKTLVPISPYLTSKEIVNGLNNINCDYLVTDDKRIISLERELNCKVLYLENVVKLENQDENIEIKFKMNETPLVMFSSGTSGSSKTINLTNQGLNFVLERISETLKFTEKDKLFLPTPLNFIQSFWSTFCILLNGGSVYINSKFKYETFWQNLNKSKSNICVIVPSIVHTLAKEKNFPQSSHELDYMIVGGDIINQKLAKELCANVKNLKLVNCYGLTETSSVCSLLLPEYSQSKLGSVGKPLSEIEIKVVDSVIHVKTPGIMRLDHLPNEKVSPWINTGDLGYFDEDGFLFVSGRVSSIIKKNGIKINPVVIENEILEFDFVKEVVVQGIADSVLGEDIIANIVIRNEISQKRAKNILLEGLTEKLAKPLIPTINIVSELVKTSSGKIVRKRGVKGEKIPSS